MDLLDEERPETGFLKFIAGRQIDGDASSALMLEYFQGTEFERMVSEAQMAAEEQQLSVDKVAHEFKQIHLALRISHKNREIEALKGRVNADPRLNFELNQQIKELAQLKAQRAAPPA
jgi:hypothetical protein